MNKLASFAFFCCLVTGVFSNNALYKGEKVYSAILESDEQIKLMIGLQNVTDLDFWTNSLGIGKEVVVRVSPGFQKHFQSHLKNGGIEYDVIIEDLSDVIKKERRELGVTTVPKGGISFKKYNTYRQVKTTI